MDGTPQSFRGIAEVGLEIYEDWLVVDKLALKLMMELAGTMASITDIDKGIESLYLEQPTVDSYTTNQAAPAAEAIIRELKDLITNYTELICSSMGLQMKVLSGVPLSSIDLSAPVTSLDLPLIVNSIQMMLLKEFEVKNSIINDLSVELPSETLSTYITVFKAQPFINESLIADYRNKLALYDQMASSSKS